MSILLFIHPSLHPTIYQAVYLSVSFFSSIHPIMKKNNKHTRNQRAASVLRSVAVTQGTAVIILFGIRLAHQLQWQGHCHVCHVIIQLQLWWYTSSCAFRKSRKNWEHTYFKLLFQSCLTWAPWCQEVVNILMNTAWWHLCLLTQNGLY